MKAVMPVLAASGAFTGATLAGLVVGLWIARISGQPLWVVGGLFAGLAGGGFSAYRLLLRSL